MANEWIFSRRTDLCARGRRPRRRFYIKFARKKTSFNLDQPLPEGSKSHFILFQKQPTHLKFRGKPKRLRYFFVYRAMKLKPTWFKIDMTGQALPEPKGGRGIQWVPRPTHYKLRGKSKRARHFFVWRSMKLKPTWFKVDMTGQALPEGKDGGVQFKPQPTNYKFRGKSKRNRFFYRIKWDTHKAPHVYGAKNFLVPSNLTWQQQNRSILRRPMKPRRRFSYRLKWDTHKAPHVYGAKNFLVPSNLTWQQQNPIVRRKPTRPRTRRYFVTWLRPMQHRKVPHVYPNGKNFLLPSNLTWQPQNREILRKPMRPRKRFRIMGKYPMLPAHIISYHVLPTSRYIVTGPGRLKKRLAQPKLDSTERSWTPGLQK